MTYAPRFTAFHTIIFFVLFSSLTSPLLGVPVKVDIQSCEGTATLTRQGDVSRIILDAPKEVTYESGGCSMIDSFDLAENPVLDFWIRINGNHSVAFSVGFGKSGIAYAGYQGIAQHALNIVGNQFGVPSLGDLGSINDGEWHHIVYDLGFAIETQLGKKPESIGKAQLQIGDRQAALNIFAGIPAQVLPQAVDLRNVVLRPRQASESCLNDVFLSLAAVPTKGSGEGATQLVAGSITSRQPLPGAELVIESGNTAVTKETFGTIQGRKDFVLSLVVPDYRRGIRAKVLSNSKTVAERNLQLLPPLSSLANATIHIIPNSHNDIAWLDSPEITADWRRDMVIGPAIPLLEKYPDYRFGMETTLFLIEYLHRAPFQAEKIRKLTAEGRLGWGATFNQPYQSLWRGESLVRQLYYGRKWMRENLGPDVDCVTAWGTDVPSVTMQMPQILAKSGVKYLMLGRFQPGVFNWYSPDGSKIAVGSQGMYGRLSAYIEPYRPLDAALKLPQLLTHWDDYYKKNDIPPHFAITDMTDYLPPTEELVPLIHSWDKEIIQKYGLDLNLRFSTGEDFMKAITSNPSAKFPGLKGEWPNVWAYIHGPTHHDTVSAGREAVWLLASAEKFWTLVDLASEGKEQYPKSTFDNAWMAQIYPDHGYGGYRGAITDIEFQSKEQEALLIGKTLLNSSIEWIAEHATPVDPKLSKLVVLNPLSWDRSGIALVDIPTPAGQEAQVVNADGTAVPVQRIPQPSGGKVKYLVDCKKIPSVGYSTFSVRYTAPEKQTLNSETLRSHALENEFYRLELVPGGVKSIYDKQLQKELLKTETFLGGEIFMLDSVGNGAHEFGAFQQPSWKNIEKLSQYNPGWRMLESGPIRTGWRIEQPFKEATLRLDVYLYKQYKRLDFDAEILNWSGEKYKEFRMAFPVNMPDGQVAYEVPYGALEVRKDEIDAIPFKGWYSQHPYDIHPREVQDWIAVSDGKQTVMLSSSVAVWDYLDSEAKKDRFTLLQPLLLAARKSVHRLGNWYLQNGDHRYHFSLTSFEGDWRNNMRFGNEINAPFPSVFTGPQAITPALPSTLSLCQVSAPNYIVSEMKKADDGKGIIFRGYEIAGHSSEVGLKLPFQIERANATNLIEENLPEKVESSGNQLRFKTGQRSINAVRAIVQWKP